MIVDVSPGEAVVVLSTEHLKHISMTYQMLGEECDDFNDKSKWHEVSDMIEEWIQWSLTQSLLEIDDSEG